MVALPGYSEGDVHAGNPGKMEGLQGHLGTGLTWAEIWLT